MTASPPSAADAYARMVRAMFAQRERLGRAPTIERFSHYAPTYRFDPRRDLEPNLAILAAYLKPEDTLLEVGGGAGRIALPLALRCKEVVNAEPAPGMREVFEACAADAGIDNAQAVDVLWPPEDPEALAADVVLTTDVTYFIAEIVPFLRGMERAARRRVIVSVWSVPPPSIDARLFELVHDEPLAPAPGARELEAVLRAMGVVPAVIQLPEGFSWPEKQPATREDAVALAVEQLEPLDEPAAARAVEDHFNELFVRRDGIYVPAWRPRTNGVSLTWEPARG